MDVPNYSLDGLSERAAAARREHADSIRAGLDAYADRARYRARAGVPVLAFCGRGRAGKDTGAEFVSELIGSPYAGSNSAIVLPLIATMVGISPERAWEERHEHRAFWIPACHAIREGDPTLLVRLSLGKNDMVAGIRGDLELREARVRAIVDCALWIDNPRVAADPTVEYGPADCDLTVCNHGTLLDYYTRLRRLVALIQRGGFRPAPDL